MGEGEELLDHCHVPCKKDRVEPVGSTTEKGREAHPQNFITSATVGA